MSHIQTLIRGLAAISLTTGSLLTLVNTATAQGQDSTIAERDIMILGNLLPGEYNNANQAYFDVRLKQAVESRHAPVHNSITRVDNKKLGSHVFTITQHTGSGKEITGHYLYTFEVDNAVQAVRMKTFALDEAYSRKTKKSKIIYRENCDLLWKQESGQFHGKLEGDSCDIDGDGMSAPYDMQLSEGSFWLLASNKEPSHSAMDRARDFNCYIDVPGVGGGRDIPYKRYPLDNIHDLGGEKWVKTDDGQELGLSLFRVMWTFNNYENIFTRPSFVVYLKTKLENGDIKENGYAWTIPEAQRIGINLKWALANCYMLSNEEIEPFYKTNEPKVVQ